jgi:hypothetical protein
MTANESAKAASSALCSTTMSARVVFGRVDFGQREDQKRNCDRENAVTEENDPFDTRLSFICHLLGSLSSDQLPPWQWQSIEVGE